MTKPSPSVAANAAGTCQQCVAKIVTNRQCARDTFRMHIECPELAGHFLPGQFMMVRLVGCNDPLIGRPFALYDVLTDAQGVPTGVEFVYLRKGKLTTRLAETAEGQYVEVWGPLGNGFQPRACQHLIMVAGGIGQTPFLSVAKERLGKHSFGRPHQPVQQISLVYGARSADRFAGLEDFDAVGVPLHLATDDGSRGHHGSVVSLLPALLKDAHDALHVVCCGPVPMMKAVAQVAAANGVTCDVSLEEPMACGIGICFSCVAMIQDRDGNRDYHRTCLEGPVFCGQQVVWDQAD